MIFGLRLVRAPGTPDASRPRPDAAQGDVTRVLEDQLPKVRALLYRFLGRRSDLDDAVQDTLIEIARSLPSFEGASHLDTWAYRVTVRVACRYLKKRHPVDLIELVPDGAEPDPESRAIQRQSVRRLQRCLARLAPKRRVAFVLCSVEGLAHPEAADIAGTSVSTLRARLKRARADLVRLLGDDPVLAPLLGKGPS